MSVLYRKKSNFPINIVVERILDCMETSNSLALTMVMFQSSWLIENQIRFTNESRNDMVLNYFFRYLARSHSPNHAYFSIYNKKKCSWVDPIYSLK